MTLDASANISSLFIDNTPDGAIAVGVTVLQPQGESWEAVLGEHAFQSL
jgi:hypothetical protein